MERIAVTGSSGHCGRAIVAAIRRNWPTSQILGLDIVPSKDNHPDVFAACDISGPEVEQHLNDFQPTAIMHLALRQINVEGTRRILNCASSLPVSRVLIGSSATAYGAWSDNPVPLSETFPLRARREFQYAEEKVEMERLAAEFQQKHPEIAVTTTRPCMIYGPGLSNYLTQFILGGPLIVLPGGNDTPLQFVHLDDVAEATCAILNSGQRGAFNIAPSDWFTLTELAAMSGRFSVYAPMTMCLAFTTLWWKLRLPVFHFPAGLWYFIRYPWVVSPSRLTNELSFQFRYSSHEVIRQLLQDAGRLKLIT
jgi:UDP-glucose 4-epimerase